MFRVEYNNGKGQRNYTYFVFTNEIDNGDYMKYFKDTYDAHKDDFKVFEWANGLIITLPIEIPEIAVLRVPFHKTRSTIKGVLDYAKSTNFVANNVE